MYNDLIINDATLPFDTSADCECSLVSLFQLISLACHEGIGFKHAEVAHGNWHTLHYADGFVFAEWINQLDKDSSNLVKNVLSKVDCPIVELEAGDREALGELLFSLACNRDIEVPSLGIASMLSSHALSAPSHANWLPNSIQIVKTWDENNEWKEELIDVPNISQLEHLDNYLDQVTKKRQKNKAYLSSLDTQNNKDFPNIIFCKSALKNISSPSVTVSDFSNIVDALKRLNSAILCSNSMESMRQNSQLRISGESKSTMEKRKYVRQREFIHPSLGKVLFEHHVKNFEGAKRMHILADFTDKKIAVGYFGSHLGTVSDPV